MEANEKNMDLQYEESILDELELEGIDAKGYGVVGKYPMIDTELGIKSKGLYAYLCSLASDGRIAFPGRDTIMFHLGISKDLYYKCLTDLKNNGYVSVRQTTVNNVFSKNIFTIIAIPKKFMNNNVSPIFSKISMDGIKAVGYGMVPRIVMFDTRINIYSKVIYSYYCVFSGAGDTACPKLEYILYHLKINETTYLKYRKELVKYDYVTITQRHLGGRLDVPDIKLNQFPRLPDLAAEELKNEKMNKNTRIVFIKNEIQDMTDQDTEKTKIQDVTDQDTGKIQDVTKQDTVNKDTGRKRVKSTKVPRTKKQDVTDQDTGKSKIQDMTKQDTTGQDTVDQDTTINNININNHKINQSIDQLRFTSALDNLIDGSMDDSAQVDVAQTPVRFTYHMALAQPTDLYSQIKARMDEERQLPYEYREDKAKMRIAIEIASEYNDIDGDAQLIDVFKMFMPVLTELCMMDKLRTLGGAKVSYANVIDQINEYMRTEGTIRFVLESAAEDYIDALKKTKVQNYQAYMQACIWNAFTSYKAKLSNFMLKYSSGSYPAAGQK